MTTRTVSPIDWKRILNENLAQVPIWAKLFEATTKVVEDLVNEQTTQLARVRDVQHVHRGDYLATPLGRGRVLHVDRRYDPTNVLIDEITVDLGTSYVVVPFRDVQSRPVLVSGARYMGFEYFSDSLSDEDYARVARFIGEYWNDSAGHKYADFIGFIKNVRLSVGTLWTADAGDYANSDDEVLRQYPWLEQNVGLFNPVYGSSTNVNLQAQDENPLFNAYPTSHVELGIDIDSSVENLTSLPNTLMEDIVSLFYLLAPIHLVLERINTEINVDIPLYSSKGRKPQFSIYDSSRLAIDL